MMSISQYINGTERWALVCPAGHGPHGWCEGRVGNRFQAVVSRERNAASVA